MKTLSLADLLEEIEAAAALEGSQEALAKRLGVTSGYLSHILSGRRGPSKWLAIQLGFEEVISYRRVQPRRRRASSPESP